MSGVSTSVNDCTDVMSGDSTSVNDCTDVMSGVSGSDIWPQAAPITPLYSCVHSVRGYRWLLKYGHFRFINVSKFDIFPLDTSNFLNTFFKLMLKKLYNAMMYCFLIKLSHI